MSNSILVRDPRIQLNSVHDTLPVIYQGASRITQYIEASNDPTSTNSSTFSFQPPSTKTIVDRHILLRVKVKFTAIAGAGVFSTPGVTPAGPFDAPRQLPLASVMQSIDCRINGGSVSDSISNKIHALMTYNNDETSRNKYLNLSPSMPDQYQKYNDWTKYGSSRNPLSNYGESATEQNRGGFPYVSSTDVVGAAGFSSELIYDFTEPLFLSPFMTGLESGPDSGLVNVNNININIKWASDLKRMWSTDSTGNATLTNFKIEFMEQHIIVNYLTPQLSYPLPLLQRVHYHKWNDHTTQHGILAPNAVDTARTTTLKLNQIPRYLQVFLRKKETELTFNDSDNFAEIQNVSVLWNNESQLLTTTTEQGLFCLNIANGSNLTWGAYSKYRGSPLRIELASQIGLMSSLAVGVQGQFTVQLKVTYKNITDVPVNYEMVFSALLEGDLTVSENSLTSTLGNLTIEEVLDAEESGDVVHERALTVAKGGSFHGSIRHFVNQLARGVQKGADVAQSIAPAIGTFDPRLGSLVNQSARSVGRLAKYGREATGGAVSGGAIRGGSQSNPRVKLSRRRMR